MEVSLQHRTAGSTRLAASVAAVLALTAGAGALAAPPAAAAEPAVGPVRSLTPGTGLRSAGAQGFLIALPADQDYATLRWIPYAGGSHRDFTTVSFEGLNETSGDMVTRTEDGYYGRGFDMATGDGFRSEGVPGVLDPEYAGTAGSAVFMRGDGTLWLDTKDDAPREVQGLPEGTAYLKVRPATAALGLIDYRTSAGEQRVGLVDLATATVAETYPRVEAVSSTRVAWTEPATAAAPGRVVVRDRATGQDTHVPAADTGALGLLGDWLLYGGSARHLGSGRTVGLFDRADTVLTTPDGTAAVVQGSRGADAGVHRVTIGSDGTPFVASLARSATAGAFVHDIDADGYPDLLGRDATGTLWRDSVADGRPRASAGAGFGGYDRIETVGDAAGGGFTADVVARDAAGVLWLHQGDGQGGFHARVKVGGGWQTYNRIAGGSDLTGDGRADLVAVDTAGGLYLHAGTGTAARPYAPRTKIGTGWGIYNQLTAVGDIGGAAAGDLLARDRDGVLWLYLGTGDGSYTARKRVGGGWQIYGRLTGAGDVDHDGRTDVLAHDPATGRVYLYRGTGAWRNPFFVRALTDAHRNGTYDHIA
ncbi:FG-GAP repeat domain-containing protein [Streptomyces sp. t39]|uniref:FG-GAP repeat domain-containing protein n=1 Tax=Streptomyces sp. t39 TaxID=1828156 RepID=UPI00164F20D9|nr:VCBS repeat-containing protein [Streptomyces sp. t39]